MPTTSEDTAIDTIDRSLILAIVTATGAALVPGSIESPPPFSTVNYASALTTVTGVAITAVSSTTQEGSGTLAFTAIGQFLTYTPPGGIAGAPVAVGAGGAFVLSGGGASPPTLGISVIAASLPLVDQSDTVVITNLYNQVIARFSADDWLHRTRLGSGTPSVRNPHGLTVGDLGSDDLVQLTAHLDLQHTNGIWRGSAAACLSVGIDDFAPPPDEITIVAPAGGDCYFCNGNRLDFITATTITPDVGWPANQTLYEVLVDGNGIPSVSARATWPAAYGASAVTGAYLIDVADTQAAGPYNLTFVVIGQTLAWDGGTAVPVGAGGRFRLLSLNGRDWVDVFVVAVDLPLAGAPVDVITIGALASTDTYLRLAYVPWTGLISSYLGYTPNRGPTPAQALDKRVYGTLANTDRADEDARAIIPQPPAVPTILRRFPEERNLDELRASGCIMGLDQSDRYSLGVESGGGLNVTVFGGTAHIFGKRFVRARQTGFALPDNSTSWVYLDSGGVLRSSTTLTLAEIVGAPTASGGDQLNNPGLGIVLAKVTTAAGVIPTGGIIDYRRNVTRADNRDALTVANPSTGVGPRAQFCSIQAAVDYALNCLGRNEIRVTGGITETPRTAISLTTQFRIVFEPDSTVWLLGTGGATSAFSLTASGALELQGTGLLDSAIDLIAYGAGANGYVAIDGMKVTLSGAAALVRVATATVDARGIQVVGCSIESTSTDPLFDFTAAFTGPVILRDNWLVSADDIISASLAASGVIAGIEIVDCRGTAVGGLIGTDPDTTLDDCRVVDSTFSTAGSTINLSGPTNRFQVRGGALTSTASRVIRLNDSVHTDFSVDSAVLNGVATQSDIVASAALGTLQLIRFSVRGCKFPSVKTSGLSLDLGNAAAAEFQDIVISGNTFYRGTVEVTHAEGLLIEGNIWVYTASGFSYAIQLVDIDRFNVDGNSCQYEVSFIYTDANCEAGSISNNTLDTFDADSAICMALNGFRLVVDGNSIRSTAPAIGGATDRSAISNLAERSVFSNNVIEISETGSQTAGVYISTHFCVVSGNTIIFTSATAAGVGVWIDAMGHDAVIAGNNVLTPAGLANAFRGCWVNAAATGCAITGNHFPAAVAPATADVDAQANYTTFLGNVVFTAAPVTVGTAHIGASGFVCRGDSTMNVAAVTLNA